MNEEVSQEDLRKNISLKLPEQDVSSEKPWGDDVLGRHQVAESLTNLISDETGPLVIRFGWTLGDRKNVFAYTLAERLRERRI